MTGKLQDPNQLLLTEPTCWSACVHVDFSPDMPLYIKDNRLREEIISIACDVSESMSVDWGLTIYEVNYIGNEEDPDPSLYFDICEVDNNGTTRLPNFHHAVRYLDSFMEIFTQELVVRGHKPVEAFSELTVMLRRTMSPMLERLGMPVPPIIKGINRRDNGNSGRDEDI